MLSFLDVWSKTIKRQKIEEFTIQGGPRFPAGFEKENATPLDFFFLMFSEDFVEHMVTETNKHAEMLKAKASQWTSTTVIEMKAYIGMCLLMGVTVRPEYKDYWKVCDFMGCAGFQKVMPRTR